MIILTQKVHAIGAFQTDYWNEKDGRGQMWIKMAMKVATDEYLGFEFNHLMWDEKTEELGEGFYIYRPDFYDFEEFGDKNILKYDGEWTSKFLGKILEKSL